MKRILLPLALAAAITVPVGAQFGWFSLNGGLIARMSSAVPAATIEQAGTGPILSLIRRGIGAVSTDGGVLRNTTAAAAGAQQYSPRSCWEGQGWKTDATAASQSVVFCMETQPVQGSSAPSGNFVLKASINGGAFSTVGTFTSGGAFSVTGDIAAGSGGGLRAGANGIIDWSTRTGLVAPSDGTLRVRSATQTNTYDITLADWGTTLSAEAVSIPVDGVVFLGVASFGTAELQIGSDNRICRFELVGTSNATAEERDGGSICSAVKDTATSVNVYYDVAGASGAGYYIQNKRAATRAIRVILIGG